MRVELHRWWCDKQGCPQSAAGMGEPWGLRALGWYVNPVGPTMYCPGHRPDPEPCQELGATIGQRCSLCRAEQEARVYQILCMNTGDLGRTPEEVAAALEELRQLRRDLEGLAGETEPQPEHGV